MPSETTPEVRRVNNVGVIATVLIGWASIWGVVNSQLDKIQLESSMMKSEIDRLRSETKEDVKEHTDLYGHQEVAPKMRDVEKDIEWMKREMDWLRDYHVKPRN